ncbi:hypothetical protein GCM10020254_71240 [Streptomyces goshikiensis]
MPGVRAVTPGPNRSSDPSTRSGTAPDTSWGVSNRFVCAGCSGGPLIQWLPSTVAL